MNKRERAPKSPPNMGVPIKERMERDRELLMQGKRISYTSQKIYFFKQYIHWFEFVGNIFLEKGGLRLQKGITKRD